MARKKEDRDGKNRRLPLKSKKTSRDSKEADADIIKSQLLMLGLTLREVPGDGNCLFRALGDQLDGHMGYHCRHRQDTTNYMLEHIDDFQPFVEDDVPFDKHIGQLSQPGTYAGNDAIVAFARLHQITVVIHQPNAPLWQIRGWETEEDSNKGKITKGKHIHSKQIPRQLHIAYHGGDHYDSVRRLGDTSHVPANIVIDVDGGNDGGRCHHTINKGNEDEYESCESHRLIDSARANEIEREAMQRSGCQDLPIVRQLLFNNCGNIDAAVDDLLALSLKSTASEEERVSQTSSTGGRCKTSFNRKKLERIRKQERKQANEARRKSINPSETRSRETSEDTVIVGKLQCLNI